MAERVAPVLMATALRGGEYERAVLDGARAHEDVPMRLAGLLGEGRRDREKRRAGVRQRAVERRKAQVIADREAEPAPRQIGDDAALARPEITRLAVALATAKVDIEHVNLVVARTNLAARIDHERTVDRAVGR